MITTLDSDEAIDALEPGTTSTFVAPVPGFSHKAMHSEFLGLINCEPFDAIECLADTDAPFGELGFTERVGKYVRLKNTSPVRYMSSEGDESFISMDGEIGVIIGDKNGRVVVLTQEGCFGWLEPDTYEEVFVHNMLRGDDDIILSYYQ